MFPSIQKDGITGQMRSALYAIEEKQKFFQFIEADTWLEDLLSVKNSLLCTTLLDEGILIYAGCDNDYLDSLTKDSEGHILYFLFPDRPNYRTHLVMLKDYMEQCWKI